jgi:hypothetical protein
MPDAFPEAFHRFERQVDTRKIRTYDELRTSFMYWAKSPSFGLTSTQNACLKKEADKKGIEDTYEIVRGSFNRRGRIVIYSRRTDTGRFVSSRKVEISHSVRKLR